MDDIAASIDPLVEAAIALEVAALRIKIQEVDENQAASEELTDAVRRVEEILRMPSRYYEKMDTLEDI